MFLDALSLCCNAVNKLQSSVLPYVHRDRKDYQGTREPRTATSTVTQLLSSEAMINQHIKTALFHAPVGRVGRASRSGNELQAFTGDLPTHSSQP